MVRTALILALLLMSGCEANQVTSPEVTGPESGALVMTVTSPSNGYSTPSEQIVVRGTISGRKAALSYAGVQNTTTGTVAGIKVDGNLASSSWSSYPVALAKGSNNLYVYWQDSGRSAQTYLTVVRTGY